MDTINFKNKEYDVLEKLGEHTFKVSRKNKIFVIKTFHKGSEEFPYFLSHAKRLKLSGINFPKVIKIDKKEEQALISYVEGVNVFDTLSKQDLDEKYYKRIFEQAWLAEHENITLDYHPDNWVMCENGELYYLKYDFTDGVSEEKNFKTTQVKFWFFTKELYQYAKTKGIELDKSRLKDEYQMNKEIVLAVVKYYI